MASPKAHVNAAGKTVWRVRYYDALGKQRHTTLPTEARAEAFLREMRNKKEQGLTSDPAGLRRTLNDWADEWFAGEAKTRYLVSGYENSIYKYDTLARPVLGKTPLVKITRDRIEDWCRDIVLNAGYARITAVSVKTIVSGVIEYAHGQCRCTDRPNPTRGARLPRDIQQVVDGEDELEETDYWLFNPLTFDEIDQLAEAILAPKYSGLRKVGVYDKVAALLEQEVPQKDIATKIGVRPSTVSYYAKKWREGNPPGVSYPQYKVLVLFLAWTGLRIGELAALRVMDLNLNSETVRVRHSIAEITAKTAEAYNLSGTRIRKPTKNGKERTVPIPAHLIADLKELVEGRERDASVFTNTKGGPLSANNFRADFFKPAAEAIGKPTLTPHALRHTYASMLIRHGADAVEVARLMGHSNPAFTLNRYTHMFQGRAEEAVGRLDKAYAEHLEAGKKKASKKKAS